MLLVKTEREKELYNCDFAKTILMIMVVFYHSILYWRGNWFVGIPEFKAPLLGEFAKWLNCIHVYGFTLISGYIFYYCKYEKNKYQKFFLLVRNKIKRLIIPYAFISMVWVIPITSFFQKIKFNDIVRNYFLGRSPSQLWFLLMLFDVFIIFYIISDFFVKHNFLGFLILAILYYLGVEESKALPNYFMIWTACEFLFIFGVGFKIRQFGSTNLKRVPGIGWFILQILFYNFKIYVDRHLYIPILRILQPGLLLILYIIGAIMIFIILQKIANRIKWDNKYFEFLNRRSMTVYLFHQQIIYFFIWKFNGLINPWVHAGINFVCSILISLIIATILMKFKITRKLIGEN